MPCMGPSVDENKHIEITKRVLEILRTEFYLNNKGLDQPNDKFDFDNKYKYVLLKIFKRMVLSEAINSF